jgi:predicted TIM-barrel fold metal-dependent hydrolase
MIGFPAEDFAMYDFIRAQLKDGSEDFDFPVEYMFKQVPKEMYGSKDPIAVTLGEMDKYGVEVGVIGVGGDVSRKALADHPDRFVGQGSVDPNKGMDGIRDMVRQYEEWGVRSFGAFNAGYNPQVAIDDAKMYPIYAKCVELGTPIFSCAGVPGPRFPMWPQEVARIDQVMYDFPELVFVTRHGCEPWEDLAVKLMLKWPNLYYSTSAFAPKHYPKAIIDYANTRGADKVIYAGYFPMGLTLERIMTDMASVPLRDEVWPKVLRENARRVLGL